MVSSPEGISSRIVLESEVELLRDESLGRGAYGRVFKAKYRGSECAAKEIHAILIEAAYTPAERERLQESFRRECDHCSKLNHLNIVHFIGICFPPDQSFPIMLMELMDDSLTKYAENSIISFKRRVSILHDVARGLSYLHSHDPPVIHRDLSPNNVLLKHLPVFAIAKIADLGVAKLVNVNDTISAQYHTKAPGTLHFMPPEAVQDNPKYNTSLDVFSYGGIILHTINGEWPTPSKATIYDTVKRQVVGFSEVERRRGYLDKMTGEAKALRSLVEACLDNDPVKRPSISWLSRKMSEIKNQRQICVPANILHKCEDVTKKLKRLTLNAVKHLNQELGRGTYCQVHQVKRGEIYYASKEIYPAIVRGMEKEEKGRFQNNLARECCGSSERSHPNIVRFIGIYYPGLWGSLPVVIMEIMDEPLNAFLKKQKVTFERKIRILCDVAEGLNYLHTRNPPVIHCNLSTDNVLLRHLLIHPVAKISDFSMFKVLVSDAESQLTITQETIAFMPPEVLAGDNCGASLDVFSYGALMLHTLNGEWPMPTNQVEFNIIDCQTRGYSEVERRQVHLNKITGEAEMLRPLIEACLDINPTKRPSIAELSEIINPLKESPSLGLALRSNCYELTWEKCADLPLACYGGSAVLYGNRVYITAAGAPDKTALDHVFVYDISLNQWDRLPPSGQRWGQLQIIDNNLTVIGGKDSITKNISNKVTTFEFICNKWTNIFPDMLKPRLSPGTVTYLNYVIVLGGALDGNECSDDIEVLNWTEPDRWVIARLKLPDPMWHLSPTISDDSLCIVGYNRGKDRISAAYQIPINTITSSATRTCLNGELVEWNKLPKAPYAGTAIVPNSCPLMIVGGYNHRQGLTSDISILDVPSNSWKKIALLASPRRYATVVSVNHDSILVIGGCTDGKGIKGAQSHSISTVEKGTMRIIQ